VHDWTNEARKATTVPRHVEQALEDLADALQVPESRYQEAEARYKSVGEWLSRPKSILTNVNPTVYVQGSFRLGTVIKPVSDAEDYDIDIVCELGVSKSRYTQEELKNFLGIEMKSYAKTHSMDVPEEGRRCWTLNYSEAAQFHLDALPGIPDGARQRLLLEQASLATDYADQAIAITDKDHRLYRVKTQDWPHSNPKGYSGWFHSRMKTIFEARRRGMAIEARANVEDIPEWRVRTPLQSAIQILKRHRDIMFQGKRWDDRPISIIITTLAAHAYDQEATIAGALYSILASMDDYIENRHGVSWIANPTDGAENFADRWVLYPARKKAFYEWLEEARTDFSAAAQLASRDTILEQLEPRFGDRIVEVAKAKRRPPSGLGSVATAARSAASLMLNPRHRQAPPWNLATQGIVTISKATFDVNGFRTRNFGSDDSALPKGATLNFYASTNVPSPFKVYWQVVNTGGEAEEVGGLRGGFDEGIVSQGHLSRREGSSYRGKHSIECFVVKNGMLAARSGQFIVNIA
jgi:hypothetical protein